MTRLRWAALLWLSGCLVPVPAVAQAPAAMGRALVGEVTCQGGIPTPRYAADTGVAVHGVERAETVKHESAHVVQLLGGCDSIMAMWARDPYVQADAEIQATCIGLTVYTDTAVRRRRLEAARFALGMAYAGYIAFGDIYRAFELRCGE